MDHEKASQTQVEKLYELIRNRIMLHPKDHSTHVDDPTMKSYCDRIVRLQPEKYGKDAIILRPTPEFSDSQTRHVWDIVEANKELYTNHYRRSQDTLERQGTVESFINNNITTGLFVDGMLFHGKIDEDTQEIEGHELIWARATDGNVTSLATGGLTCHMDTGITFNGQKVFGYFVADSGTNINPRQLIRDEMSMNTFVCDENGNLYLILDGSGDVPRSFFVVVNKSASEAVLNDARTKRSPNHQSGTSHMRLT
jgi:hypothetical protein